MLTEPTLCLVTDRHRWYPAARTTAVGLAALEAALDAAASAGIDVIQIRERDVDAAVLATFVRRVMRRIEGASTRVVVNDRIDVALAAGTDGVHLRSDGPGVPRTRAVLPPGRIVGRSIHHQSDVDAHAGADYFVFGTMFATGSKALDAPRQSLDALAAAVERSAAPVWAIGGITPATAALCLAAGARGVAAIGAYLDGADGTNGATAAGVVRGRVEAMRRAVARPFEKQVE